LFSHKKLRLDGYGWEAVLMSLKKAERMEIDAIPQELMNEIISVLQSMTHGNITLTTQNFRLVQIERNEKIRPCDIGGGHLEKQSSDKVDYTIICQKIQQQFRGLEYGEIVVVIKAGKIVQVERTEKYRLQSFMGLDGEGI